MSRSEPPREEIYLDYAATSALRPPAVVAAVCGYLRDIGATPGRSGHRRAMDAGRVALHCRQALAALFNAPGDPGRVVFQPSATYALNAALAGLLRPGGRVVRTAYDHNAVRRAVALLGAIGVRETVLSGAPDGSLDPDEVERALHGGGGPPRVLVLPHVSNVLGSVLPVAELAERAHAVGTRVVLDAAQSAGHIPVDVEELGVDVLAFSGHKGLLGPQGTGGMWIRDGVEIEPRIAGGTGSDSASAAMPEVLPDRLEPGTQNGPGIAGLLAGVEWLRERGMGAVHARERALKARLRTGLEEIPGVRVLSPSAADGAGIVLVTVAGAPAAEVARRLDQGAGVLVRAGLHCAPETHALLGTTGEGAVRYSLGWASSEQDVDAAIEATARIAAGAPVEVA